MPNSPVSCLWHQVLAPLSNILSKENVTEVTVIASQHLIQINFENNTLGSRKDFWVIGFQEFRFCLFIRGN